MNTDELFEEVKKVVLGPVGGRALFEHLPAPAFMGKPFMDGVILVKAAPGTLIEATLRGRRLGVMPAVFDLGDALVCVVLTVVHGQYFPIYVNLRNEREVAPLRAMARQGFATLCVCDGSRGMASLDFALTGNMFADIFDVLESSDTWTEAQYREARKELESFFESDPEGLKVAVISNANLLLAKNVSSLAASETVQ